MDKFKQVSEEQFNEFIERYQYPPLRMDVIRIVDPPLVLYLDEINYEADKDGWPGERVRAKMVDDYDIKAKELIRMPRYYIRAEG